MTQERDDVGGEVLASTARSVTGLRAETSSFIGRGQDLADVTRLIRDNPLVTLTGIGGVGKTRLALRAAADMAAQFRDGVYVVELSMLGDSYLLPHTIASAVRLWDQTSRPIADVLHDHLVIRELLLVLDTCEHHLKACADLAARMHDAPGLRILATSRQALGVPGEAVLRVAPLAIEGGAAAAEQDALRLFADRARGVVAGFALTPENTRTVTALCRRLDGIPLAIELAAVRLRDLSLDAVESHLDDRFDLLRLRNQSHGHAHAPRHQSLRAAIDWSFELCSASERLLWTRLAIFPGDFDRTAAESVCSDDRLPPTGFSDLLTSLISKSIVQTEEGHEGTRYRLLDTVRDYGREHLRARDEYHALAERYRDHYLDLAERFDADWFGPRQPEWSRRIHTELANLRAALTYSLSRPDGYPAALQLAGALFYFWWARGAFGEGIYWLKQALTPDGPPSPQRHRALAAYAMLLVINGRRDEGMPYAHECLRLARELGEPRLVASATDALAVAHFFGGDYVAARVLIDEAEGRYWELDERAGMDGELARATRALVHAADGQHDAAAALLAAGIQRCRLRGERWWLAYLLNMSTQAALDAGDPGRADETNRESLELRRALNDPVGVWSGLERFAWSAVEQHEYVRGARLLGAAEQCWRGAGTPVLGARVWNQWHEPAVAKARAALGDDAFDAEFQRGMELRLRDAVAYALAPRDA